MKSLLGASVATQRQFSVTYSELYQMDARVRRKFNAMRQMDEQSDFTYEPPEMIYNKETGDVTILPKKIKKKGTVIKSVDDLKRERAALYAELGVKDGDINNLQTDDAVSASDIIYKVEKQI